ncbi:MAG: hypothetical protein DRH23_17785, partial [Deltaproteobacteria bacterium]
CAFAGRRIQRHGGREGLHVARASRSAGCRNQGALSRGSATAELVARVTVGADTVGLAARFADAQLAVRAAGTVVVLEAVSALGDQDRVSGAEG